MWSPQNHIQWGGGRDPQRTSFWVPFNHCAPKLSSISWPALSISPSKKTFTVGKTNADNKYITFWGFFPSPNNRHLETEDDTWTYSAMQPELTMQLPIISVTTISDDAWKDTALHLLKFIRHSEFIPEPPTYIQNTVNNFSWNTYCILLKLAEGIWMQNTVTQNCPWQIMIDLIVSCIMVCNQPIQGFAVTSQL